MASQGWASSSSGGQDDWRKDRWWRRGEWTGVEKWDWQEAEESKAGPAATKGGGTKGGGKRSRSQSRRRGSKSPRTTSPSAMKVDEGQELSSEQYKTLLAGSLRMAERVAEEARQRHERSEIAAAEIRAKMEALKLKDGAGDESAQSGPKSKKAKARAAKAKAKAAASSGAAGTPSPADCFAGAEIGRAHV